ncbi:GIY-YIG nuclease family protein [Mesorhizobium sp. M0808]|uniref:GIY-YIG nuclease family protein n=1 Tax=Mesorhizobium sp. M0808 TaxID=2957002 RepID=UPI003335A913
MIYFLEAGPYVKIGYTNGIRTRLNDLQVGCPYKQRLLATLDGDERLELQIHDLAEDFHHRAEWFHHRGNLKRWIGGANITRTVTYADGAVEYCFKDQLGHYDEFDAYLVSIGREPGRRIIGPGLKPNGAGERKKPAAPFGATGHVNFCDWIGGSMRLPRQPPLAHRAAAKSTRASCRRSRST